MFHARTSIDAGPVNPSRRVKPVLPSRKRPPTRGLATSPSSAGVGPDRRSGDRLANVFRRRDAHVTNTLAQEMGARRRVRTPADKWDSRTVLKPQTDRFQSFQQEGCGLSRMPPCRQPPRGPPQQASAKGARRPTSPRGSLPHSRPNLLVNAVLPSTSGMRGNDPVGTGPGSSGPGPCRSIGSAGPASVGRDRDAHADESATGSARGRRPT